MTLKIDMDAIRAKLDLHEEKREFSQAEKARATLERIDTERAETIGTVIKDDSNKASFPGFPYKIEARGSSIIVNLDLFRSGYECKTCKGTGYVQSKDNYIPGEGFTYKETTCPTCEGRANLLVLPDTSKSQPCTGVVVSIGPDVDISDIHLYDRVIFGPFSGRFIPISKAGIMLKIMDQREATAVIYGGEDMASFDFIDIPSELGA